MIDAALCERCAACLDVCPVNAVRAVPKLGGRLYVSDVPGGSLLVHAALIPGEDTSGKLVRAVRQRAEAVANGNTALLIMDAPPGIGCPVIASLSAVDLVVVVIEAGNSGIRDAQRLFQLLASMKRHSVSIINKAGIDPELDTHATALAARYQSPVLATIPFDRRFRESTERSEAWIGSPDPEVRQPALAMCQALAQALDLGSLSTHPIRPQGGHT
jgi:MinD superfamily P-loop ATPase